MDLLIFIHISLWYEIESVGKNKRNEKMSLNDCLKVLIVDDTIFYRKIISDILQGIEDTKVVGSAGNGKIALSRISVLKPDLLILDIEMPEMNGLDVLRHLKKDYPDVGAIMLSTLTREGSEITIKALELGAFDFIQKPQSGTLEENKKIILESLKPRLKAWKRRIDIKRMLKRLPEDSVTKPVSGSLKADIQVRNGRSEIVGIGISTGGPKALSLMLPKLPINTVVPVVIVQHMPPLFTRSLAKNLNSKCILSVKEAVNGEELKPGTVFLAAGGKQMKISSGVGGKKFIRITDDPPENSCKPSVDYLFRSIAHHYADRATGVIMTGMGNDGTKGLTLMKQSGAYIIAQNEATCTVYGMPKTPVDNGIVDIVVPLEKMADEIIKTVVH
ncbi:MAG: chemotaxis response regulator protein-glutamate methylesterase [Thermodesulfobacteriota bacterium]|nr:chemotaxis response regulator protein-glutamate methylesterase [Thermodesulfobacteriota bacterium]